MKKTLFIILLLAAIVIESRIRIMSVTLNLTVIFVYFIGLRYGPAKGMGFGAIVGFICDTVAGGMIGPCMLGKMTVGYLAHSLRKGFFIWTPVLGIFGLLALTMTDSLITYLAVTFADHQPAVFTDALIMIFMQGMINALAGALIKPDHER